MRDSEEIDFQAAQCRVVPEARSSLSQLNDRGTVCPFLTDELQPFYVKKMFLCDDTAPSASAAEADPNKRIADPEAAAEH